MNDRDGESPFPILEQQHKEFVARERERTRLKCTIEPLIASIAAAEAELANVAVLGARERFFFGRARLDLLQMLAIVEKRGDNPSENTMRSLERATGSLR